MSSVHISLQTSWRKHAVLFLASQNISLFGSSVTGFAIIWHVTLQTSSGIWMMAIVAASMLPQVAVSLWGGVLADRHDRKRLIMAADGGIAAATLVLAALYLAGYESLWMLLAVAAVRSLGSGIQAPAVSAVIPQIVPTEGLTRFNGINQAFSATTQLLAPAVGGIALGTIGIGWAFMLDVLTAALAIVVLRRIPIPKISTAGKTDSAWAELRNGLTFAWASPLLRSLIICYGVSFFLMSPAAFLTPIMLERTFGNDVWLLTAHELVWTAASMLGGAYIAWRGTFKNKVRVIAFSLVGFGVTFCLLGTATLFPVYLLYMGIAGFILPFFTTAETVLIQELVEAGMLGRVFSLVQLTALSAMPLGMFFFGPLADVVRIQYILIVTGALLSLVGMLFARVREPGMVAGESEAAVSE